MCVYHLDSTLVNLLPYLLYTCVYGYSYTYIFVYMICSSLDHLDVADLLITPQHVKHVLKIIIKKKIILSLKTIILLYK